MAEKMRVEEGGEKQYTPEQILEKEIRYGFAEYPLSPDEIERRIRLVVKEKGINPEVGPVIRKILKRMVATGPSADREIASLIAFCKLHNIPYAEDYSAEKLEEMERLYNYQVEGWIDLLSKK